jgi:hypothetical protein
MTAELSQPKAGQELDVNVPHASQQSAQSSGELRSVKRCRSEENEEVAPIAPLRPQDDASAAPTPVPSTPVQSDNATTQSTTGGITPPVASAQPTAADDVEDIFGFSAQRFVSQPAGGNADASPALRSPTSTQDPALSPVTFAPSPPQESLRDVACPHGYFQCGQVHSIMQQCFVGKGWEAPLALGDEADARKTEVPVRSEDVKDDARSTPVGLDSAVSPSERFKALLRPRAGLRAPTAKPVPVLGASAMPSDTRRTVPAPVPSAAAASPPAMKKHPLYSSSAAIAVRDSKVVLTAAAARAAPPTAQARPGGLSALQGYISKFKR